MHMRNIDATCGLRPGLSVLEVGCGIGRDAIPLTEVLGTAGNYVGFDIVKDFIDWCSSEITPRFPNFRFHHFDVRDQLHNPGGTLRTRDIRIPAEDGSIDLIILQSVFTHMFEPDIVHYLREFRRVLAPEGRVYATCFIVTDAVLEAARRTNATPHNLRFEQFVGRGCYLHDPAIPASAVAYRWDAIYRMIHQGGLLPAGEFLKGAWSGYWGAEAREGQDVMVLKKALPATPVAEVVAFLERYLAAVEAEVEREPAYGGAPLSPSPARRSILRRLRALAQRSP